VRRILAVGTAGVGGGQCCLDFACALRFACAVRFAPDAA
jgi:hypothetical protein